MKVTGFTVQSIQDFVSMQLQSWVSKAGVGPRERA
jgi:hypothetical protein